MKTSYENLPYNVRKLIYTLLPVVNQSQLQRVSKNFFPSSHCKKPSQKQKSNYRLPNNMKGHKYALQKIKGGDTSVNTFVAAVPDIYKKILFPGYSGHDNARSLFSSYNKYQRINRYTTLMEKGNQLYTANLQKKVESLFSQN